VNKYINVNRIEFIVTWRCNSLCKHCSVSGKRGLKPAAINAELATRIIKEVTSVYSPTSIMTFGGEPLLYPEIACAIHSTARACGIGSREIITNAGYSRSEKKAREVALKLAESGVNHINISVDAFHQENIPVRIVEQNVRALLDVGIPVCWNPCWVISKEDHNPWNKRTREILNVLGHLHIRESEGNNVSPAGNATKYLRDYLPEKVIIPHGNCEDVPYGTRLDRITGISIEPDSNISVCKNFYIGNARERNVSDILQSYDPYKIPEMAAILQGGIAGLAEFARRKGVLPKPEGYYSICDECIDLRHRLADCEQ
jgi:hypothetical protein